MNISYKQIMSFDPCYNPKTVGMPEDYEAPLSDFIKEYRSKVKSISDIHWIILRPIFFNAHDRQLFAIWCAQQVKHLMTDQRSINALDVTEKFAFDEATQQEKTKACAAAKVVAFDYIIPNVNYAAQAAYHAAKVYFDAAYAAAGTAVAEAAHAASAAVEVACAGQAAYAVTANTPAKAAYAIRNAAAHAADAARKEALNEQLDKILEMIEKPNGQWFIRNETC